MPLPALQKLSSQTGDVTSAIVTVDSVDHLDAAVSAITKQLGTAADVAADSSASMTTLDSLQNIKTISTYSLVGALVAAVVITFLLMLMIVRERRREIGVLKSIGGSNSKITLQFVAEAVTFTLMAAVAGILVGIILANPVLDVLVKNSSDTTTATSTFGPRGQGRGFPGQGTGGNANGNSGATAGNRPSTGGQINFGRGFGRTFSNVGGTLDNLKTAVGFDIVLYGILAALLVAIVGSALPAYSISKVRPAEVMRSE
jgi:putative ABC transport system permease protein